MARYPAGRPAICVAGSAGTGTFTRQVVVRGARQSYDATPASGRPELVLVLHREAGAAHELLVDEELCDVIAGAEVVETAVLVRHGEGAVATDAEVPFAVPS